MHYQIERNHGCRVSDSWTYRGLKTVILENDLLRVVILADKGADIYQFIHKPTDLDFMWRSPWGVRDPSKFIATSGGLTESWLDVYEGGWQTVLPGGGFPSEYSGAEMGLHAEVNTIPWDCNIIEDTLNKVSVRFWVRTYRTPMFFEKTLTLVKGSPVLEIEEVLTNEGEEDTQCVWGEHITLGPPFLSENCIIDLPGGTLFNHPEDPHPNSSRLKPGARTEWPWTEGKNGEVVDLRIVPSKEIRAYDQSYITDVVKGWYAVRNTHLGLGFGVQYDPKVFPYLWYWQSLGGGFGYPWYGRTYNIGLEPFTSFANQGLASAISNGTALKLSPGEKVGTKLKAVAFTGTKIVSEIRDNGSVIFS